MSGPVTGGAGQTTALLVIDMQMEMAHRTEAGRDRANPQAEAHVAGLLALPRADGSRISAAAVPDVTLALPGADFAQVMPAIDVVTALQRRPGRAAALPPQRTNPQTCESAPACAILSRAAPARQSGPRWPARARAA